MTWKAVHSFLSSQTISMIFNKYRKTKCLKAHRQISKKLCFEKYDNFQLYTELFGKPHNWRQIYKQTSSTFQTFHKITRTSYAFLITFERCRTSHRRCSIKKLLFKICSILRKTPALKSLFNSEYCTYFEEHLRTAASENAFMKLRITKNYSYGILTLH